MKRIYGITEDMLFPDFDGFARQRSQDVEYIQPASTVQHRELADEAFQKGEYEEAISNYNRAIELDQNDVVAYCNRGIVKYQLGQYQAAINDFDEAVYRGDNDAYTYFLRGISKYMLEQYADAIDDYDEAIRRDSNHAAAYYHRAEANFYLGHLSEARVDLQTASQLVEQTDDADLMKRIDDLLYEVDS